MPSITPDTSVPDCHASSVCAVTQMFTIMSDPALLRLIKEGYEEDPFCSKLKDVKGSLKGLAFVDDLWFIGGHLVIPHVGDL
jgi:hypothetical protein